MIVGAPRLKRYQAFGNYVRRCRWRGLPALTVTRRCRAIRFTPMNEADLRVHLRRQTARRIELIDMVQLRTPEAAAKCRALQGDDGPGRHDRRARRRDTRGGGKARVGATWRGRIQCGVVGAAICACRALALARPFARKRPAFRQQNLFKRLQPSAVVVRPSPPGNSCWARASGFHVERLNLRRALDRQAGDARDSSVPSALQPMPSGEVRARSCTARKAPTIQPSSNSMPPRDKPA